MIKSSTRIALAPRGSQAITLRHHPQAIMVNPLIQAYEPMTHKKNRCVCFGLVHVDHTDSN